MDTRVAPLADILRLNTVLFRNCLDGLERRAGGDAANGRHQQRRVRGRASDELRFLFC